MTLASYEAHGALVVFFFFVELFIVMHTIIVRIGFQESPPEGETKDLLVVCNEHCSS